ncbi:MAG: hypothetical protein D6679_03420 [Candidatus Hydrogenedentota bacterium]|nr:MAG: hypothetical protein D6679_03420 [Candidatus Hydrogenedentota bacterium]
MEILERGRWETRQSAGLGRRASLPGIILSFPASFLASFAPAEDVGGSVWKMLAYFFRGIKKCFSELRFLEASISPLMKITNFFLWGLDKS